ncbi:hypothetical protein [Tropicimonas isoalkanivorans]|uniref:Tetratricopeptide repeat-containing protein n=1 Tax=Tropicimonas isoalkanivorans TaxID=441112 RepID=A0A1I1E7B7_9RHOB|nr:hypothetical protein [Tropicimonas isoalkanivorans]SFB82967.1 hypothetical protein SAMN04488094_101676 [Tropicimonas isoalkanivorans]
MFDTTDRIAQGATLLVNIAAAAADPSGLVAAQSATGGYFALRGMFRHKIKGAEDRIRQVSNALNARLTAPTFHTPAGADAHLPEMLLDALPTPEDIAAAGLDPDALVASMCARFKREGVRSDFQPYELIECFGNWVRPEIEGLLNDSDFVTSTAPSLFRTLFAEQQSQRKILDEVERQYGSLAKALGALENARRDQLEAIAVRFEIERAFELSEHDLRQVLMQKAEEYRTYRAQIDALDERVAAISNLKGAAQGAAERLDFDEVETLLARVDAVETEIAAETKEARARNALLRGQVEDAYRLLCAAADSFGSLDPLEPARRRIFRYNLILWDHGRRYGGAGLARAAEMLRPVLTGSLRRADTWLWVSGQGNLANAMQDLGSRTAGATGARSVAEAVMAYRAILRVYPESSQPLVWARTQNNLAIALLELSHRTRGVESVELLAESVDAHRAALRVYAEQDHPLERAITQSKLANALAEQYNRTGDPDNEGLLVLAAQASCAALRVLTEHDNPAEWAAAQNSLGNALAGHGTSTGGQKGASLLAEAVEAYRATLRVYTEASNPVAWAGTQNNLGNALSQLGHLTVGAAGLDPLDEAVQACRAALRVRTEHDLPRHWAETQGNLANALKEQGRRMYGEPGVDRIAEAVDAYRATLRFYTEEDFPVNWAKTHDNMALAEAAIAEHNATTSRKAHVKAALDHVETALRVFDPTTTPHYYNDADTLREQLSAWLARLEGQDGMELP